jgi:hypothetical protein
MAKLQDIPMLVTGFIELAKEYLLQETVGQAKKLGRFAGFSLGAALLWSIAVVLIGVAVMRGVVDVLPAGSYWEALGYLIAFILFAVIAVALLKVGSKQEADQMHEETGGPA